MPVAPPPPAPAPPPSTSNPVTRYLASFASGLCCAAVCFTLLGLAGVFAFVLPAIYQTFNEQRLALPTLTRLFYILPPLVVAGGLLFLIASLVIKEFILARPVKLTINLLVLGMLLVAVPLVVVALFLPYIAALNSLSQ